MGKSIEKVLNFRPRKDENSSILYSFDIFDTLLARRTTKPIGVFYNIKDKIKASNLKLPLYLTDRFPKVRKWAEKSSREYKKSVSKINENTLLEISLDDIYKNMQDVYAINPYDIAKIKEFELQAELDNSIGIQTTVNKIKTLIKRKKDVILISDMYLPEEFIRELLRKVSPKIAELPIYLSSKWGIQKTTKELFLKAYDDMGHKYSEWIHCGDNEKADYLIPNELGIKTVRYDAPKFNKYEKKLISNIDTYDAYLVATLMQQFRTNHNEDLEYFSFAYVSLYLVPYIGWVIEDAIAKKFDTLYFIARDGHYLKIIADTIIKTKGYKIKTKYIYGSRKAWRIPSFIDHIDESFYQSFGNFSGVDDYETLLNALHLQEKDFLKLFPQLESIKNKVTLGKEDLESISFMVKNNKEYTQFLLDLAKKKRVLVIKYLKQEIDFQEKFAFVEYWGRGYTQDCLTRLIEETVHKNIENPFYYMRSIYPSRGSSIRYNFTTNPSSPIFVEAIFANLPYDTTKSYQQREEIIEPIFEKRSNIQTTHLSLETYLPLFAKQFAICEFTDSDKIRRDLLDFASTYFEKNQRDPLLTTYIAPLRDSAPLYGKEREFAPILTYNDIRDLRRGISTGEITASIQMSLARSSKFINFLYDARQNGMRYCMLKNTKKLVKNILKRVSIFIV